MSDIESYGALHDLPEHAVVQDANGQVWCVQHYPKHNNETWLSPFSDEYAAWIKRDGTVGGPGDTPALPIKDLGIITSVGG